MRQPLFYVTFFVWGWVGGNYFENGVLSLLLLVFPVEMEPIMGSSYLMLDFILFCLYYWDLYYCVWGKILRKENII